MNNEDKEEFQHDWYGILDCPYDATEEVIQKCARKLSVRYHPDKTSDPSAPEKFLLVQKAKEILLNSEKRKEIDSRRVREQKRKEYETTRLTNMDSRRKRLREEFEERLKNASERKLSAEEILQAELKKQSKIIQELRKKSASMMEKSTNDAQEREYQKAKDYINMRKAMAELNSYTQVKVKWKRTNISESDDSLYRMFKVFGDLDDVSLVGTKGTSAIVTFKSQEAARAAVAAYADSSDYRVTLTDDRPKTKASVFSFDYNRSDGTSSAAREIIEEARRAAEKEKINKSKFDDEFNFSDVPTTLEQLELKEKEVFSKLMAAQIRR